MSRLSKEAQEQLELVRERAHRRDWTTDSDGTCVWLETPDGRYRWSPYGPAHFTTFFVSELNKGQAHKVWERYNSIFSPPRWNPDRLQKYAPDPWFYLGSEITYMENELKLRVHLEFEFIRFGGPFIDKKDMWQSARSIRLPSTHIVVELWRPPTRIPEQGWEYQRAVDDLLHVIREAFTSKEAEMSTIPKPIDTEPVNTAPADKAESGADSLQLAVQAAKNLGLHYTLHTDRLLIYRNAMGDLAFHYPLTYLAPGYDSPQVTVTNVELYQKFRNELSRLTTKAAEAAAEDAKRTAALDLWEQAAKNLGLTSRCKRTGNSVIIDRENNKTSAYAFCFTYPDTQEGAFCGGKDIDQVSRDIEELKRFRAEVERLKDPMPDGWHLHKLGGVAYFIGPDGVELRQGTKRAHRDACRQLFDWLDQQDAKTAKKTAER